MCSAQNIRLAAIGVKHTRQEPSTERFLNRVLLNEAEHDLEQNLGLMVSAPQLTHDMPEYPAYLLNTDRVMDDGSSILPSGTIIFESVIELKYNSNESSTPEW